MNALKGIILALCIIAGALFAMCDGARAECIYVDSAYGSDSNAGTQYAPVATWARAIELGAASEGIGVVWATNDTPTVEVARLIISGKDDRESVTRYRVLIEGHQSVNVQSKEQSTVACCKVITDYLWEIYDTPGGEQAERMIGENTYVLAY